MFGWLSRLQKTTPLSPAPVRGNSYVFCSEGDTVFVFIHGLLSSAATCWANAQGKYWPAMVAQEEAFSGPSVFVSEYHTSVNSETYDISQCVAEVLRALKLPQPTQRAPLSHARIIFVCHSLGGVVCRRLLEEHRQHFAGKSIGVVLLASPSLGSKYAAKLQTVGRLYGHQIARQLLPSSDSLKDIDNRFRSLLQQNEFLSLSGVEAVEHHGPVFFKGFPRILPPVVDAASASRYFGPTRILPNTDHFSIVKPASELDPVHLLLREYYLEFLQRSGGESAHHRNTAQTAGTADPLFDVYQSCHRACYVDREVDRTLDSILSQSSVWISGVSGVGKTSLAKRWVSEKGLRPIEIPLGHLHASSSSEVLTDEINQSLASCGIGTKATGFAGLVDAIALCAERSSVPIFVDEVPIELEPADASIPAFFGSLLDASKRKTNSNVKFIVCSVNSPKMDQLPTKMREQYRFLTLEPWRRDELISLYNLVRGQLALDPSLDEFREIVAERAGGTPRFVKTFFRYLESSRSHEAHSPDLELSRKLETLGGKL